MTHDQIAMIRAKQAEHTRLKQASEALKKNLDVRLMRSDKALAELQKTCDHRLPDGSSADDGGFMFGCCLICGYFDL